MITKACKDGGASDGVRAGGRRTSGVYVNFQKAKLFSKIHQSFYQFFKYSFEKFFRDNLFEIIEEKRERRRVKE